MVYWCGEEFIEFLANVLWKERCVSLVMLSSWLVLGKVGVLD